MLARAMGGREEIRVESMSEPLSHYTDAVRGGDQLYISGVAPLDGDGRLVGAGDPVAQTRRVFENMAQILDAAGASFADIVKITVYLKDVSHRQAINPVRQEFFGDARPASTLVEVSDLAVPGMLVEVEAVAWAGRA
ncbi:MAG: RidA family protein [Thermoleophilaceae bacterium]|nr:RidA family protein [Thermoleophilaceae bacterium]